MIATRTVLHGLRANWRSHLVATAIAAGVAIALPLWFAPPRSAGVDAATASGVWLNVPTFLLTAIAIAALLEDWPTFGRERNEGVWLTRLPGAGASLLAASTGALLRLAASLFVVGVVGAVSTTSIGGVAAAESRVVVDVHDRPVLTPTQPRATFAVGGEVLRGLRLRPSAIASPGLDYEPVVLRVGIDGEWQPREVQVRDHRAPIEFAFSPRTVREVVVERSAGRGFAVAFDADAIDGIRATSPPQWLNGGLAAAGYAAAAAVLVALLAALHRTASLLVLHVVAIGGLFAATTVDLMPHARGVEAFARGRFVLSEPLTGAWLLCLLALMVLCAVPLRPGAGRPS